MTRGARARRALGAIVGATAGLGCDDATGPRWPAEGPPEAMVAQYDAYGYGSQTVRLRGGDTLVVTRVPWDMGAAGTATVRTVVPDAGAWRAFWATTARAGLTRWPSRCVNRELVDGGGLSFALTVGGRVRTGSYTNASPRRDGTCTTDGSRSAEEQQFGEAVGRLVGAPFP